jgi:hypothetical protein
VFSRLVLTGGAHVVVSSDVGGAAGAGVAVTSVSAGPPVGVVRTGQRFSRTLVAQRTDRVWLEIDGRQYAGQGRLP